MLVVWAVGSITAIAVPTQAEPFQSYKGKKHRGGQTGKGTRTDDRSTGWDAEDEEDVERLIGAILTTLAAGGNDGEADRGESVVRTRKPGPMGPCHYEEFHGCVRACDPDSSECRRQCRNYAESICGGAPTASLASYTYQPPTLDFDYSERVERFFATFEGGGGGVEGGGLGTLEGRFGFGHYGVGFQTSLLGGDGEWLLEADFGPHLRLNRGDAILAVQPSIMVSAGNGVTTLVGGGARVFAGWQTDEFRGLIRPLFGVIGQQLNIHFRSSFGYRFSGSFFGQLGYDLRVLRQFGGPTESVVHGLFVGFGYQTD